jgi:hypothetical protein
MPIQDTLQLLNDGSRWHRMYALLTNTKVCTNTISTNGQNIKEAISIVIILFD